MKKAVRAPIAALLSFILFLSPLAAARVAAESAGLGQPIRRSLAFRQLRSIGGVGALPFAAPAVRPMEQDVPDVGPAEAQGKEEFIPGLTRDDLAKIFAIATIIRNGYVDPVESQKLYYGAVKGMAKELDPHSVFFTPEEFQRFKADLEGTLTGIGAGMKKKEDGKPQGIMYTMPGSPAEKAGLKAGDQVLEVNGRPTAEMTQEDVVNAVRGPAGTQVTLKIGRMDPATQKPATLTVIITRARVETANAFSKMLPGSVGYVYFSEFRQDTDQTVAKHVRKLVAQGARSLVVDVRNNPGGSLEAVAKLTASFLKKGQVVFSAKNREGKQSEWAAPKDGEFKDIPMKVLVNGYSASASEVFSGALQDHKRATIIGSRSYGKGTAQSIIPFPDGSALKLTMQRWYTPSGRSIQKDDHGNGGVTPDVAVSVPEETEVKVIGQIVRELNGAPPDGTPAEDPALQRALQ